MTYMYSTLYMILYIYIYCPKFAGFKNIRLGFAHFEMAIDHPKPSPQNIHRHVLWLDPSVGISPSRIRRVRICENCISFDLGCLNQFCAFPPKLPYASKSLPTPLILEHQQISFWNTKIWSCWNIKKNVLKKNANPSSPQIFSGIC